METITKTPETRAEISFVKQTNCFGRTAISGDRNCFEEVQVAFTLQFYFRTEQNNVSQIKKTCAEVKNRKSFGNKIGVNFFFVHSFLPRVFFDNFYDNLVRVSVEID